MDLYRSDRFISKVICNLPGLKGKLIRVYNMKAASVLQKDVLWTYITTKYSPHVEFASRDPQVNHSVSDMFVLQGYKVSYMEDISSMWGNCR